MGFIVIWTVKYNVVNDLGRSHALLGLVVPGRARLPQEFNEIRLPAILLHVDTPFENDNVLHHKALDLPIECPTTLVKRDPARGPDDTVPGHVSIRR